MYNSIRPHGTFWENDLIFARFIKLYSFALSTAKAELPDGGVVLDAATGLGYGAEMLSDHFEHVTGIDLSKEALDYASANYKRPIFQKGNVLALPFSVNNFEAVFSIETLEHLAKKDLHVYLDELLRVTKPGGLIFISTPNKPVYSSLHKVDDHYSELTLAEVKSLIKSRYGGDIKYYAFGTRVGKNLKILNKIERFSNVARRVFARIFGIPFPRNISFEDALNFWDIKAIETDCESYGYLNIAVIGNLKK